LGSSQILVVWVDPVQSQTPYLPSDSAPEQVSNSPADRSASESPIPSSQEELTIEALQNSDRPFVLADALGQVVAINAAFQRTYGWTEDQLRGQSLSLILPGSFQMSHQLGFSRFQATEQSTILAHPLRLKTVCADGSEVVSEHFILGEKRESGWVFGATLTPLPGCVETDA
jgi:PAS domain S-box-containing protein